MGKFNPKSERLKGSKEAAVLGRMMEHLSEITEKIPLQEKLTKISWAYFSALACSQTMEELFDGKHPASAGCPVDG